MGVIMSLTSALKNLSESGRQKLKKEKSETILPSVLVAVGHRQPACHLCSGFSLEKPEACRSST
jgi:hypothetical protein